MSSFEEALLFGIVDLLTCCFPAPPSRFEAAWNGDIETIKSYTLGPWGATKSESPLIASVKDGLKCSPFAVAFLRGHRDVARAILDIVEQQYDSGETPKVTYRLKGKTDGDDDDDDDDNDDDGEGGDSDLKLVARDAGEKKFTIDNIDEVATQVKCTTSPLSVLLDQVECVDLRDLKKLDTIKAYAETSDLLYWFVREGDREAVNILIELGLHFAKPEHGGTDENGLFEFPSSAFSHACINGPVPILADIIRRTGSGIPIDHLVRRTGVAIREKPKFYQGLSVYGKKRQDWANAGRNLVVRNIGSKIPPVLDTIMAGRFELLHWFMSEIPRQHYIEYAEAKAAEGDKHYKHIAEMPGGLDRALTKWLGVQSESCFAIFHSRESVIRQCKDHIY